MTAKQTEAEAAKDGAAAIVRFWSNEITAARKREKNYRKEGERIRKIYAGEKKETVPFNILYSNTETMMPAYYSSTPKPIVQRRFKDADPVARAAAMAGQRTLEFLIDTNMEGYETFDNSMRDSVLDALLPGRGLARAKYEAEVTPVPTGEVDAKGKPITTEVKTFETVCTELVPWNRVYFGFYRKWAKCPWIAFEHFMDRDESGEKFGKEVAGKMHFTINDEDQKSEGGGTGEKPKADTDEGSEKKTCLVYEIWKRKGKKVCFIAPTYQHGYLKEEDDPLELTGFYPLPKPLQFLMKTEEPTPTALYELYENQAKELNKISIRINRIVEAMKVRGVYDGALGDTLSGILEADDNTLSATNENSKIKIEGGIDKSIWFMPLDQLVATLAQLIIARQECKQIIYEVTGLSDIIRGQSDPNATATAEQIKNQWGSLRVKMNQNEVRRYVREMLRIMLEIAASKFSPETFAKMTGLPFTTQAQKQQAQMLLMAAQASGQANPQDPALAQAQQTVNTPDWEAVIALLQDDISRSYRIDIETNSTVEVNEQEDKQNITEALTAIGSYLEGVAPMVQNGSMPFEAAKSILLAIVRKFRFGTEVEEEIKTMQAPQPQPDPKVETEKMKASAELQRMNMEGRAAQANAESERQLQSMKMAEAQAKHAAEMEKIAAQREADREKARLFLLQLRAKSAAEERSAQIREKEMKSKAAKAEA